MSQLKFKIYRVFLRKVDPFCCFHKNYMNFIDDIITAYGLIQFLGSPRNFSRPIISKLDSMECYYIYKWGYN